MTINVHKQLVLKLLKEKIQQLELLNNEDERQCELLLINYNNLKNKILKRKDQIKGINDGIDIINKDLSFEPKTHRETVEAIDDFLKID